MLRSLERLTSYTCQPIVTCSIPGVHPVFRIVWIVIPAYLIKQANSAQYNVCVSVYESQISRTVSSRNEQNLQNNPLEQIIFS